MNYFTPTPTIPSGLDNPTARAFMQRMVSAPQYLANLNTLGLARPVAPLAAIPGPSAMPMGQQVASAGVNLNRMAALAPRLPQLAAPLRPLGAVVGAPMRAVAPVAPLGAMSGMSLPVARAAQALGPYGRAAALPAAGLGALAATLGLLDSPAAQPRQAGVFLDTNGNTVNAAGTPQIPAVNPQAYADPLAGDPEAQQQAAMARVAEVMGVLNAPAAPAAQAPRPQQQQRPAPRPAARPQAVTLAPTWEQRGFTRQADGSYVKVEPVAPLNALLFGDDQ
jgi:hypothetical protein